MPSQLQNLWRKFRYRITHASRFPKGDLTSFLWNLYDLGFRPKHIVDVGANRGRWSEKAQQVFPDCSFTLLEPQIEMKAELDGFCRKVPNARWINAGAGDELGILQFTVVPDTVSSTFTISESDNGYEQRQVKVVTLDHLVENEINAIPDLVKIDAEGFELRILQGAQSLIGKTEVFLLELPLIDPPPGWSSFSEIITQMGEYGYEPFEFTTFLRLKGDPATRLCEIAFARRNGMLRANHQTYESTARAA